MEQFVLTPFDGNSSRHSLFKEMIFRAVKWKWGMEPRWGAIEGKNLDRFLAEMPQVTEREFAIALKHLLESDDVPAMQRPGYWLPRLESYIIHSHNCFGKRRDAGSKAANSKNAAERFLADKRRNHSGVPATDGAAVDVAKRTNRAGLRALGSGFGRVSAGGD